MTLSGVIPFADQDVTPVNFTHGGVVRPARGLVLHIAQGSYSGTIGWEHNPKAKISSYCVVGKLGQITQVVNLNDRAWTEAAGNSAWIGIEFEGKVPDALTPAQITAAAKLLAFLHTTYGVPVQITDDPVNGHGLAYHSLGGKAWSPAGHTCPGPAIVAQRPAIIAMTLALLQGDSPVTPTEIEATAARAAALVLAALPAILKTALDNEFGGYDARKKWTPRLLLATLRSKFGVSS